LRGWEEQFSHLILEEEMIKFDVSISGNCDTVDDFLDLNTKVKDLLGSLSPEINITNATVIQATSDNLKLSPETSLKMKAKI
jgi:hypothetical protein